MRTDDPHATPRPAPRVLPPVVLVGLAFGAGLVGGLAARWIDGEREPAAAAPGIAEPAGAARIASEISALTEAVRTLAARDERPAGGTPEPLRPDPAGSLDADVAKLSEALARLPQQPPTFVERAVLSLPKDSAAARSQLHALLAQNGDQVRSEHIFLGAREIVERYGIPDAIDVDDRTVALTYRNSDEHWWQQFRTLEGVVIGYTRQNP